VKNHSKPPHDVLREHIRELPLAGEISDGLRSHDSLAPDNITFFRRGDQAPKKAEGVSSNYHHRFELALVAGGTGPVRIDQTSYLLQPHDTTLIFPNQFHHYLDPAAGEWLFLTFEIRSPETIQALRDSPRTLDDAGVALVGQLLGEFLHPAGSAPDTLAISYQLSRLLRHLVDRPEIPGEQRNIHAGTNARDVILEKINAYIREHLSQSVTISDIALELGYSVSHLRAVFRDRLGVSLGRYMRESRLSAAAQLLQRSNYNVSEIGERCGFESLYAFSRAFRKAYGIPPRAYRQLVTDGRKLPPRRAAGSKSTH
jgi:AraC-like DNA-binding protein